MKHSVLALLAIFAFSSQRYGQVVFQDDFGYDSISDYTLNCYPDATGSATWEVTDGLLHGIMSGGGQCYASIHDPSWEITSASCRVRGVSGIDKGLTVHNSIGHLAVNLRAAPYNDMMVTNGHAGDFVIYSVPHTVGQWVDVEIRIVGSDMQVFINGSLSATRPIAADVLVEPFSDARVFVYNGTVSDYDDIRIEGTGVSFPRSRTV